MTQAKSQKPVKQGSATDVINLLKADHKKVKDLFTEFEGLKGKKNSGAKKEEIVKQICQELTIHALAEEAIVYPAAREAIKDEELMDEADVEHAGAKELIAQLQTMSPDESHYDAKVTVLREYIEHHVKEEEGEMFPKLRKSGVDREAMAEEITHFKEERKDESSSSSAQHVKAGAQSHRDPASDLPTDPIRHGATGQHAKAGSQSHKNK